MDSRGWWINAWRPATTEATYELTDIEGELPPELHGTLYRSGPSQRAQPARGYGAPHLFDGDGLVHALRIDEGRVFYASRFVAHPDWQRRRSAGRHPASATTTSPAVSSWPMPAQPNSNVVFHGDRLLAMVEHSVPFRLDPYSLASLGTEDFGARRLGGNVSAHPRIDARTGQMIVHGYQPFQPYLQYYVVEADGSCSVAETVDAPYPVLAHDMAITEHYAIVPWAPVCIDATVLAGGGRVADALSWQPERGLRFAVRERSAGSPSRWFTAPSPAFVFHLGNAYEQDGKILLDACSYLDGEAMLRSLAGWRSASIDPAGFARLFQYELDLTDGSCRERVLADSGTEFPRLDDRRVGYRNRYGYALRDRAGGRRLGDTLCTVVRYDREGGADHVHDFGKWQWSSEPVFVARAEGCEEDDGFVLCVVYDGRTDGSYLAVLDARNLAAPPLAQCRLEHRIPMGFHGSFVPGVI